MFYAIYSRMKKAELSTARILYKSRPNEAEIGGKRCGTDARVGRANVGQILHPSLASSIRGALLMSIISYVIICIAIL